MQPITLTDANNLRLGLKFDENRRPQTTVSFTVPAGAQTLAALIELYREQPLTITITSPQIHLFNPGQEEPK